MSIDIVDISKSFNGVTALDGVNLSIRSGEMVALLGPSGSGKTTLLRILAGLEWATSGDVLFDGASAAGRDAGSRRVGFVFQHYALFRHMTVFDNIAFGLRVRPRGSRPARAEIRTKVERLLDLVQLPGLGHRFPSQLSGGQRQRVALARALAIDPKVLLLDEPFGALDARVRKDLRRWLRALHDEIGTTSVFVTHDQEEALEIADRVVVMGQGRIEQIDSPQAIYDRPANPFVYRFLGNVNELPCEVRAGKVTVQGMRVNGIGPVEAASGASTIYVRPGDIEVRRAAAAGAGTPVRFISFAGAAVRLGVERAPATALVEIELPRQSFEELDLAVGAAVDLEIRRGRVFQ